MLNELLGTQMAPDWKPPTDSGWHWLQKHEQHPRPFYWNAVRQEWHDSWDGSVRGVDQFSTLSHRYIAPCPVPNGLITSGVKNTDESGE